MCSLVWIWCGDLSESITIETWQWRGKSWTRSVSTQKYMPKSTILFMKSVNESRSKKKKKLVQLGKRHAAFKWQPEMNDAFISNEKRSENEFVYVSVWVYVPFEVDVEFWEFREQLIEKFSSGTRKFKTVTLVKVVSEHNEDQCGNNNFEVKHRLQHWSIFFFPMKRWNLWHRFLAKHFRSILICT